MTYANHVHSIETAPSSGGKSVRDHWKLYALEGAILMVLGCAAVLVPTFSSIAFVIFLGWLFFIGGVVGLTSSFAARDAPGFIWSLLSSVLALVVGISLFMLPDTGAITLMLVFATFLILDGLLTIAFGLDHRRELSRRWGWLVANGVLDIVLAGLIVMYPPASAAWMLGLIIGIDLMFGGMSLLFMGLSARDIRSAG